MTLGQKQEKFSRMMMLLMLHLHSKGYNMRGGHWFRCRNCYTGMELSVHKEKLAFDINLTYAPTKDERPRMLTGTAAVKAHAKLHDYWDSLGGAKRIEGDYNHYSLGYRGRR